MQKDEGADKFRQCVAACDECSLIDGESPYVQTPGGRIPTRMAGRQSCGNCKFADTRRKLLELVKVAA